MACWKPGFDLLTCPVQTSKGASLTHNVQQPLLLLCPRREIFSICLIGLILLMGHLSPGRRISHLRITTSIKTAV
jgi:hypothetical protein